MKKYKIQFIILLIFLLQLSFVVSVHAQYAIENTIPGGPAAGTEVELTDYLRSIYIFLLSLVGITAFGVLVYGGVRYMTSGAMDSSDDAKKWMWGAVLGLLLAFSSWLILNTINPDLVGLSGLSPDAIPPQQPPPACLPVGGVCSGPQAALHASCCANLVCDNTTNQCREKNEYEVRNYDPVNNCSTEGGPCEPDGCCQNLKCDNHYIRWWRTDLCVP